MDKKWAIINCDVGFVYMITNPKGRIYTGSTHDIKERWYFYTTLKCKLQTKLYRSFMKYGVENHIFEIVWNGDINDMYKYESMIGTYYECLNKGLNCRLPRTNDTYSGLSQKTKDKIGKANKGTKHSEKFKKECSIRMKNSFINGTWISPMKGLKMSKEAKLKLSNLYKGVKRSDGYKLKLSLAKLGKCGKIVLQYDLDDNFIKEWRSCTEVGRQLKIISSHIGSCCKGNRKTTGGFKWKYKE